MAATADNIWQVPIYLPYLQPPLKDTAVAAAQKKIGFKLPIEYLELLKKQNGGYIRYGLPGMEGLHRMIAGIGPHFPSVTKFSVKKYQKNVSYPLAGLVPFDGDGHWHICLDYRKNPAAPSITYADVEVDSERPVADSFADYLTMLKIFVGTPYGDDYVLEGVADLETVKAALSRALGLTFEPPDTWAYGYAVHRARLGGKQEPQLPDVVSQWVSISPNMVPRGFVREEDARYAEVKDLMPGEAPRFPEVPAAAYILHAAHGLVSQTVDACAGCDLSVRPLREYLPADDLGPPPVRMPATAEEIKYSKQHNLIDERAIIEERGLIHLKDAIVPDCGLDDQGMCVFDFGSRQFTFVLDTFFFPRVLDAADKVRDSLPKPGAKDDAVKAKAAMAAWNQLKKALEKEVPLQRPWLEKAMVDGQRWSRDRFEAQFVRHPLMSHLARRLVWGVYGPQEQLLASFRVTEEPSYVDFADKAFDLGSAEHVGIVYPIHLTATDAAAWSERFGEPYSQHGITAPFPQLGRPFYKLEPEEENGTHITRFTDFEMPIINLTVNRQGCWFSSRYGLDYYQMFFPGQGVTARLEFHYVATGSMKFGRCYFVPLETIGPHAGLSLSEIHPVALSETLRSLTIIRNIEKGLL